MKIKSYRDLVAWQKAMDLVVKVYETTKAFPKDEIYGLTAQLRKAAVSIPSNIAEGHGRASRAEYCHFLSIAYGSLLEAETQVLIGVRLSYLAAQQSEEILTLTGEVGRLLNGLSRALSWP